MEVISTFVRTGVLLVCVLAGGCAASEQTPVATETVPSVPPATQDNPTADKEPPLPPGFGFTLDDHPMRVHEQLIRNGYRQTAWNAAPPLTHREYAAENPSMPFQLATVEICQSTLRITALRLRGPDSKTVYAIVREKYGIVPWEEQRQFAGNLQLTLSTEEKNAVLLLEAPDALKACHNDLRDILQKMDTQRLEQRKENNRRAVTAF